MPVVRTKVITTNITSVQQRLGNILLPCEPEQAIELFDWTIVAAQSEAAYRHQLARLKKEYDQQESTLRQLRQQMDEFIEAKKEHETLLMSKFRDLLNSKKLKIRDQRRLLVKANVEGYRGMFPKISTC